MRFVPADAAYCCTVSNLAYDAVRANKLTPEGSVLVGDFAFVARRSLGRVVVGFQGTNSLQDALRDCNTQFSAPKGWKGCPPAHPGFCGAVEALLPWILKQVAPGDRLVLTGHSMGAAIAVLMAARLKGIGYTVEAIYGFGCPRVGGVLFANYYEALALREVTFLFAHGRDGIPFEPWWGVHVAPLIWLDLLGHVVDERIPRGPWWNLWRLAFAEAIDHSADQYTVCMAKLAAT